MKNQKYSFVRTVPKSNRENSIDRGIDTPNTHVTASYFYAPAPWAFCLGLIFLSVTEVHLKQII